MCSSTDASFLNPGEMSTFNMSDNSTHHVPTTHHDTKHGHGTASCPVDAPSYTMDDHLQSYWCQEPHHVNGTVVDGEYNEGNLCTFHSAYLLKCS